MKSLLTFAVLISLSISQVWALGENPGDPGMGSAPEPASTFMVGSALVALYYKNKVK